MPNTLDLPTIADDPDSLNRLSLAELRALWGRCCPKTPPSPHRAILVRDLAFVAQSGGTKWPRETDALIRAAMKAASVIRSPDEEAVRVRAQMQQPKAVQDLPPGAVLMREGHTNKRWLTAAGQWRGGQKMTVSHVNKTLRNVVYIGKVQHGKEVYPGQHQSIIDEALWNAVQDSINNQQRESRYRWRSHFLLQGKFKTHEGYLMSPYTHHKASIHQAKGNLGKQPRYYVSRKALTQGYAQCPIKSLNADLLEDLITSQVFHYLVEHNKPVYDVVTRMADENRKAHWIRELVESVVIGPELIVMTLNKQAIVTTEHDINSNPFEGGNDDNTTAPPVIWYQPEIREEEDKIILSLSILIRRVNGIRAILSSNGKDLTLPAQPTPDPSVVQAIGRGFRWKQMLNENPKISFKQFEANVGYSDSFITKQISLIGLAPDILHRALTGTLPPSIKLNRLYEAAASLSWERQRQLLDLN